MIYIINITTLINEIVNRNIIQMKKTLARREQEYLNVNASGKRNELKLLERIFTKDDASLIKK